MKFFLFSMLITAVSFSSFSQEKTEPVKVENPQTITTKSGLQYTITQKGNGQQPELGDDVILNYTGKFTNDTVFDSTVKRGLPFAFRLGYGNVIRGWDEAFAYLRVGDKATLRIPPALGYGEKGNERIPANSTLIFDVEVLDVKEGQKPWKVASKDTIRLPGGLKYIMVEKNPGGIIPKISDRIKINYTGFYADGRIFDSSIPRKPIDFKVGMGDVIKAWDQVFLKLRTGEKARLFVPYKLAYGEEGIQGILPKTNLIFDVELIEIMGPPKPYDVKGKEVHTTQSGLKYVIVHKGNDTIHKPAPKKFVTVDYAGFLQDGTLFDTSVGRNQFQFMVGGGQVIKGLDEGIQLMNTGDKFEFIIPAGLAYGDKAFGPVPAKSTVTFDVELHDVK